MPFDPYQELDVPRDASDAEIRAAHKKRVKETHPDAGGTAKAFNRTQRALACLTNAERRRKFDATGEDDDDKAAVNPISAPITIILNFLTKATESFVSGQGGNPLQEPLVDRMKAEFARKQADCDKQKQMLHEGIKILEKIEKKLTTKTPNEFLKRGIARQVEILKTHIASHDRNKQGLADAIELLKDYSFLPDPQAHHPGGFISLDQMIEQATMSEMRRRGIIS